MPRPDRPVSEQTRPNRRTNADPPRMAAYQARRVAALPRPDVIRSVESSRRKFERLVAHPDCLLMPAANKR